MDYSADAQAKRESSMAIGWISCLGCMRGVFDDVARCPCCSKTAPK